MHWFLLIAILVFPFLCCISPIFILPRKASIGVVGGVSSCIITLTCGISWFFFYVICIQKHVAIIQHLAQWIEIGTFNVNWSIYIDSLTSVMLIVVTSISALVHIYSIGYMKDDPHYHRFFSYLGGFTFAMLLLVVSDNFLQLFCGWEMVGLFSYLLIGFWFKKRSANMASLKAFIINRVADSAFVLAIALIYYVFNTLNFSEVFSALNVSSIGVVSVFGYSVKLIDLVTILLFLGCMGKSAQIGFHTWLPDAMEGPTPVSALIHAATMVTAGVFLVVRCSPIFELSPLCRSFIMLIGAITCIMAALSALGQNDIKKIIAYSTCSQLGYMMMACGSSFYTAAMVHLFTHAFFKALLFLSAGNIITAAHHEQDITKMSGMRKLKITHIAMLIGSISICGFPPFSGYFSKEPIIEAASGGYFWIATIAAFCTALYSFRLYFHVFLGDDAHEKHKYASVMRYVIAFLSIPAACAGYFSVSKLKMLDIEFWHGSIVQTFHEHHMAFILRYAPLMFSIFAIPCAYVMYLESHRNIKIITILKNAFFFDCFYSIMVQRPICWFADVLNGLDTRVIDQIISIAPSRFVRYTSNKFLLLQDGCISSYAFVLISIIAMILLVISLVMCSV